MSFMKWHPSGGEGVAAMSKDLARTVNFKPRGNNFFAVCVVFFFLI